MIIELDDLNRPKQKCALLYGPPGLGKTTLAHIIAATAGYNAVEMNASDDRSLEKFQQKLESATQMRRYCVSQNLLYSRGPYFIILTTYIMSII